MFDRRERLSGVDIIQLTLMLGFALSMYVTMLLTLVGIFGIVLGAVFTTVTHEPVHPLLQQIWVVGTICLAGYSAIVYYVLVGRKDR